jgi:hypothetical protein
MRVSPPFHRIHALRHIVTDRLHSTAAETDLQREDKVRTGVAQEELAETAERAEMSGGIGERKGGDRDGREANSSCWKWGIDNNLLWG